MTDDPNANRVLGRTASGEILFVKIQSLHILLRRAIIRFIVGSFCDGKLLRKAADDEGQYNRLRGIYLLGRFKQLEEMAAKRGMDSEIVQRMKYVIKFQTRFEREARP